MDRFVDNGKVRMHFREVGGHGPSLVLMHGLTANAHAFDGVLDAGLDTQARILIPDLRGRGRSSKADDYTMAAHAGDILAMLDSLGLEKATMGGHSFGGLLSLYIACHFPERVERLILMDAAAKMHPDTKEMLGPALGRLVKTYASFEAYIEEVKAAPYMDQWSDKMRSYYEADVTRHEDGTVSPIPTLKDMVAAVTAGLGEPWLEYIAGAGHEALLINGPGIYTLGGALLPEDMAMETVAMMQRCTYVKVPGNHQTMLYNQGAVAIAKAIDSFLKPSA